MGKEHQTRFSVLDAALASAIRLEMLKGFCTIGYSPEEVEREADHFLEVLDDAFDKFRVLMSGAAGDELKKGMERLLNSLMGNTPVEKNNESFVNNVYQEQRAQLAI
ncbi:MAG: hypothetical protein AAB539_01120 [Patescibacteria group bacterium]